ncbi:MAG: hypothetical protein V7K41_09175 [Nostoc sp.]
MLPDDFDRLPVRVLEDINPVSLASSAKVGGCFSRCRKISLA